MQNLIRINGCEYPQPQRGISFSVTSNIDWTTNANGQMVGQKVGRDRIEVSNLQWAYLKADVWSRILKECSDGVITVSYPDMVEAAWKSVKVAVGERKGTPCHIDPDTGLPLDYVNCQIELIDMGG